MAKMFCLGAFPKNDLLPSGCRLDQRRAEPDLVHIWMLVPTISQCHIGIKQSTTSTSLSLWFDCKAKLDKSSGTPHQLAQVE